MLNPSLNHVFVVVRDSFLRSILSMCQSHVSFGVTRSQTSRYFVDLMFSLHVTNRSLCVDALIGGNYVATMLVTINGHLKVLKSLSITVREYQRMTSLFLSVCLSILWLFFSLSLKNNAPSLMHQQCISVF